MYDLCTYVRLGLNHRLTDHGSDSDQGTTGTETSEV